MRRLLLLIGLLTIFGHAFFTASAASDEASLQVTQLLRGKDQALLDAIAVGDTKVWDKALAGNAVYVDENGTIMQKEEFLKQLIPLPAGVSGSIAISSYSVTLHGDIATVVHTDDEKENYHGSQLTAQYLTTETWQKTADDWQLLQVHTYAVLKDPPAQTLSSKELDAYVGKYAAGDLALTVRREGDHLVSVREGRPDVAWSAELLDVFFIAGQPRTRKIFGRNSDGKITGFAERREGTDLVWKKIG